MGALPLVLRNLGHVLLLGAVCHNSLANFFERSRRFVPHSPAVVRGGLVPNCRKRSHHGSSVDWLLGSDGEKDGIESSRRSSGVQYSDRIITSLALFAASASDFISHPKRKNESRLRNVFRIQAFSGARDHGSPFSFDVPFPGAYFHPSLILDVANLIHGDLGEISLLLARCVARGCCFCSGTP